MNLCFENYRSLHYYWNEMEYAVQVELLVIINFGGFATIRALKNIGGI